ncbi:PREDICTED: aspartic proteinase nepenthesin-1 [Tarenaya hassleriana]|uniref:aspartic proteinase nepenthesin-1 n=1 Tax=Tarenaya hassleriana TaxID=28532 RepID=UPI00053C0EED|nr:PREDICTED: aspartic proteinase nepenthesin-1 [Tarenaya hassleriana]
MNMASSTSRPLLLLLLLSTAIFALVLSSQSGFVAPILIPSLHDQNHHTLQTQDLEGFFFPIETNLYIQLAIGTPLRTFNLKLDPSTHLTWLECEPCNKCFLSDSNRRFNGISSNTFSAVPCNSSAPSPCSPTSTFVHARIDEASFSPFLYCLASGFCGYDAVSAEDSISSAGNVVSDTLHLFSSISVAHQDNTLPLHGFVFGCGTSNTVRRRDNDVGVDGRASLTTHRFSLLSQLRVTRFSHCLWASSVGPRNYLRFGSAAEYGDRGTATVAMINVTGSYLFHVSLLGISVGAQSVMRSGGTCTMAIEIGTYFTHLETNVYEDVKRELLMQIGPTIAYEVNQLMCFARPDDVDIESLPKITLHLGRFDYSISNKGFYFRDGPSLCAAIVRASAGGNGEKNVLGASALVDHAVGYDVSERKISFRKKDCLVDFVDGM